LPGHQAPLPRAQRDSRAQGGPATGKCRIAAAPTAPLSAAAVAVAAAAAAAVAAAAAAVVAVVAGVGDPPAAAVALAGRRLAVVGAGA